MDKVCDPRIYFNTHALSRCDLLYSALDSQRDRNRSCLQKREL